MPKNDLVRYATASACFAACLCSGQDSTAKLDASITAAGAFQASLILSATGQRGAAYRDAFEQSATAVANPALFGSILQGKQLQSPPVVTDDPNTFQVLLAIFEPDFLLPIHRQQALQLDLLPFERLLGVAGRSREEITVTIPPGFELQAPPQSNLERTFASYRSEARIDGGKLVIVRELLIKPEPGTATELSVFGEVVREDHQHRFILRRIARVDLNEWTRSVPTNLTGTYGFRAYQQRQYEAARQLLERAVQAKPDDASAWNNLGRALAALGKLEDAQKAYEKQIAINPKDSYAYNNLGLLEERLGQWDKAVQSFRKQLEVHPGDTFATANLPRALIHAGGWSEAAEAASKALQLQPNNTQRLYVAVAHVCAGGLYSHKDVDTALGPRPTAALLNNAAYFLSVCEKEMEAAESYADRAVDMAKAAAAKAREGKFSTAVSSQVALATHLDTLGWLLFQQGKTDRALNLLRASVAFAGRGEPYTHLAQAEAKGGHDDLAMRYWRQAKLLEPGLVPADIATRAAMAEPFSIDREWYEMKAALPGDVAASLAADQQCYFFAIANGNGELQSIRELDAEDAAAKKILQAMHTVSFPAIQMDGVPEPAVYIVRVMKSSGGNVTASRSVGAEALAIAADLSPGEFPLPVSAIPSTAPSPGPTGAYRIGGGVTPPRILHKVEPQYSEEARRISLEGIVRVKCVIGPDGKPREFEVLKSMGMGLDENAILAASAWQFQPGAKEGNPVSVYANIDVTFHMLGHWRVTRAEFHVPPGASRPVAEKGGSPHLQANAPEASATLSFDIDEHGNPANVRVEKSSDEGWANDVTAALRKWKFSPAVKDGSPVTVPCTMDFIRAN